MKPRSAKSKGRTFQNHVADKVRELLNTHPEEIRPALMSEGGMDIKLSPRLREIFPFSIECKNRERFNIWEAIHQAEKNKAVLTWPAVMFKRNRQTPWVAVPEEAFYELVKGYIYLIENGIVLRLATGKERRNGSSVYVDVRTNEEEGGVCCGE